MHDSKKSARISLVLCVVCAVLIVAGAVAAPFLLPRWGMMHFCHWQFWCFFYPSCLLGLAALFSLSKLLRRVIAGRAFCVENVRSLWYISLYCLIVALITFIGGWLYTSLFLVSAAAGFVGMILRTVKSLMQSATEMREENDLTV